MLDSLNESLPDLFRVIDLTGVFLNGIIGGRLARQKGFDAVGFAVLALMSAMGGGILRDVMLQAGPPLCLNRPLLPDNRTIRCFNRLPVEIRL